MPKQSGLDFGGGGWPVLAAARGKVIRAEWLDNKSGYGVILDHGDGWQTWYVHLQYNPLQNPGGFNIGDEVPQGKHIGVSGVSAGHLHLELRRNNHSESWDGKTIDGWKVHSIEIKDEAGRAFNYHLLGCTPQQVFCPHPGTFQPPNTSYHLTGMVATIPLPARRCSPCDVCPVV